MGNAYSRDSYSELVSQSEWRRRHERGRSPSPPHPPSHASISESTSSAYPEPRCFPRILPGRASDRGSDVSPSHSSQAGSDLDYMYPDRHSRRNRGPARSPGQRTRIYSVEELEIVDIFEVLDQGPPVDTLRPGDEYFDRPDSNGFRPRRTYNPHGYSHFPPRMPAYHPYRAYGPSSTRPDPHPGQPWYPPSPYPTYDDMVNNRPPRMLPSSGQQPRIEYREPRSNRDE